MMRFKVIILDFDGTLIESVGIKDQAFKELFKDYPEHLNEIISYHLSHNATIRYDKFKYINEKILGQPYTKEIEKKMSEEFSHYVFEHILRCPYVQGAIEFLDYFYSKIPLYIVSVNPAWELARILDARELRKYFKKIYANPGSKTEAIRDIIKNENLSKRELVFIGDTIEDYQAAKASSIFFIGRGSSKKSFKGIDIPIYSNLIDIKEFICS